MGLLGTQRANRRESEKTAVGDLVEGMAVGVVGLKQTLTPAREPMLEGNNHSVVVGHSVCCDLCDLGKAGICTGRHRRACTEGRRQRAKTGCIGARILHQTMNAMIAEVTSRDRSTCAKS